MNRGFKEKLSKVEVLLYNAYSDKLKESLIEKDRLADKVIQLEDRCEGLRKALDKADDLIERLKKEKTSNGE